MKHAILGLIVLATLGGCHSPVRSDAIPSAADVNELEARLARYPCVGDLNQWERNYRFFRKSALFFAHLTHPDVNVIELHIRKAGKIDITPGRNVMAARPDGDWPDSRRIQSMDGRYVIATKTLSLSGCRAAKAGPSSADKPQR